MILGGVAFEKFSISDTVSELNRVGQTDGRTDGDLVNYSKIPGTDFNDTFVPVSRSSTIRLMMALSVEHDLIVHQIDVVSRCFSTEKNKKHFICSHQKDFSLC